MAGQFPDRLHLILIPAPRVRRPWWHRWRKRLRKFEVSKPFRYSKSGDVTVQVPQGTVVDGGSIPCFWWRIIGNPWGEYAEATVIHDYLWSLAVSRLKHEGTIGFRWANEVFLEGMRTLGVSLWRRFAMWVAVSVNGRWVAWRLRRICRDSQAI